ncbi:MAG: hypothetical protein K8E66_01015, partial [Phycisphaerales bacterium]|nr:hypothetical protein [Phycisphaerales bacterium]
MPSRHPARVALLAVVGLAMAASAQSVTLEFRADRTTAAIGETVHWEVWEYYDGYPDPEANFGGFVGDFVAAIPEVGLSSNFVSNLNSATMPRAGGASVENINLFSGCVMHFCPTYSGELICTFDVEIVEPFVSLSYDVAGTVTVFPDDFIFSLPDEYCRDPIQGSCDDPGLSIISDTVTVGHIPGPSAEMWIAPDRALVYRGDTIRWTASLGFPGWGEIDAHAVDFTGDLFASTDGLGPARDPAGLLGGEFAATIDGASLRDISVVRPGGGAPDRSNPIDLLTWVVDAAFPDTLAYSVDGEATLFNGVEGRTFDFGTIVTRSGVAQVEWAWPGPTRLRTIEPPDHDIAWDFGSAVALDGH